MYLIYCYQNLHKCQKVERFPKSPVWCQNDVHEFLDSWMLLLTKFNMRFGSLENFLLLVVLWLLFRRLVCVVWLIVIVWLFCYWYIVNQHVLEGNRSHICDTHIHSITPKTLPLGSHTPSGQTQHCVCVCVRGCVVSPDSTRNSLQIFFSHSLANLIPSENKHTHTNTHT